MITELKYGKTRTYIVEGSSGRILIDTDWAKTIDGFYKALKELDLRVEDIKYLFITHFHPDHMGIARELMELGIELVVVGMQKKYIHFADGVLRKGNNDYLPIDDSKVMCIDFDESREFLQSVGIDGEIIHTPGHSDDSISFIIDGEAAIVGDLYPIHLALGFNDYEVEDSWNKILSHDVKRAYYGHARSESIEGIGSLDEL